MPKSSNNWPKVPLKAIAANTHYPIGDGDHGQIKPAYYQDTGIPYIRVADMGWGELKPNGLVYISEEVHKKNLKSELLPDDVLIAKTGATIGKCCILPNDIPRANTTSSVGKVTVNTKLALPKWLLYFFLTNDFKSQMWAVSEKTAQPGFNIDDLKEFILPLPSLALQTHLVSKLDRIFNQLNKSRAILKKTEITLSRLRQSTLSSACSGKLTASWRKQSKGIKPQLGKFQRPDTAYFDNLPDSWTETTIGAVTKEVRYGTSKKCSYDNTGTPVLRIPNIENGTISHRDIKFAVFDLQEREKLSLRAGDILLIRSNGSVSLVGKAAIISEAEKDYIFAGYLIRIRVNTDLILPEYLTYILSSFELRKQIEFTARSTSGVNNINSEELRNLHIPLPPVNEQAIIVNKIRTLFNISDDISFRHNAIQARFDRLGQSTLTKVFHGQL